MSAQASEQRPRQQRAKHPYSAIRRMYKRAGADEGIVPLSYRRRSTPALCHSQNERSRPRKRRNNIPNSSERNARALPFAVCTNVPVLMKESYLWHAESGSTPALCHPQDERSHPHKRRNNIPNSSERNARARQFSERATVLAADAFDRPLRFRITRREGEGRTPPSPSFWKARFINLFAGKSPPLPFIRRYTIPVVNAA